MDRSSPIRVLVVDDSRMQRELLVGILNASTVFQVAGTAASGQEAIAATLRIRPHVIAMDIHLPQMNGYEATRQIMQRCPTPVVLLSGSADDTEQRSLRALAAGALAVVQKPGALGAATEQAERANLLTVLRVMAGVRVAARHSPQATPERKPTTSSQPSQQSFPRPAPKVLAIAASTGGPAAIQVLLSGLGAKFQLPIVIAQHISHGFSEALIDCLRHTSHFQVGVATASERLVAGKVYLPPDDHHLLVSRGGSIRLQECSPTDRYCPSADFLFESIAGAYGRRAIGVILTGMGDDGARGLRRLHDAGSITIAQDQATSVVYGMPQAAVQAGAVTRVEPVDAIARVIMELTDISYLFGG